MLSSSRKTDAFYRIEHQMIFDAIVALYEKNNGGAIDAVLLRDELEKAKTVGWRSAE